MKIYITENNRGKIEIALNEVQKLSKVRTITVQDIFNATEYLEEKLAIPKKHMEGITARIDLNAQSFPRAYKYRPESTIIKVGRSHNKWALVDCYRGECVPATRGYILNLTEQAKKSIINNYTSF